MYDCSKGSKSLLLVQNNIQTTFIYRTPHNIYILVGIMRGQRISNVIQIL